MSIPTSVAVDAYRKLGLTKKTRKHPYVLVKHCMRQTLGRFMRLREIQDIEHEATGKRPHHTTIMHSINEMRGQVDIHLPAVLSALAHSLNEHNNAKLLQAWEQGQATTQS